MAKLIRCKDCGNQISKNAASCPQCGAKNKQTSVITWLALIFIGIPFLWAIFSGASNPDNAASTESIENNEPSQYETMETFDVPQDEFDNYIGGQVAAVEMLVRKQMKDPESAQFQNWHYVKAAPDLPATICAEVSGKNSFNGYTGYRKFLVKMDTTEFGIERSTKGFDKLYNQLCILK